MRALAAVQHSGVSTLYSSERPKALEATTPKARRQPRDTVVPGGPPLRDLHCWRCEWRWSRWGAKSLQINCSLGNDTYQAARCTLVRCSFRTNLPIRALVA